MTPSLQRLWALAGHPLDGEQEATNDTFGDLGLQLCWPAPPNNYKWATPANTLTLGYTGGDGVHFGLLLLDGALSEDSPVVMTVPMASEDEMNFVVGETLQDFLALGCRRGYCCIEELAYSQSECLDELADTEFPADMETADRALLTAIATEFDLQPWGAQVGSRLDSLRERFGPLLAPPVEPL